MKILYIITQADGGGAQGYTLTLAKHFKGLLAAGTEADQLFTEAQNAGVPVFRLKYLKRNINPIYDLMAVFEIAKLIKQQRPDIVHLNSTKAGFLGSLTKPFHKAKIIFTAHGFRHLEPLSPLSRWFYKFLEKLSSRFRDSIITIPETDRRSAIAASIISQNKISTIHNGLAPVPFLTREQAKRELNIPPDKFVFGTIANFYKTKGLDVLVDAISRLNMRVRSRYHFVLIGDGPEFLNLKSKILNLNLNNIRLPGKITRANMLLPAFDAFVLPSRKEGFPYALLEAMQAGLPIIASKTGGIGEALGDAGWLVPPEDAASLARALAWIADDAEARRTLSQKAQKRAAFFSEERMLMETQKVYEKVLR